MDGITIGKRGGPGWEEITLKELNDLIEDGTLGTAWHIQRFVFNKL